MRTKVLVLFALSAVVVFGCSEGARRFFFEIPDGTSPEAAETEAAVPAESAPPGAPPEPRYASVHAPYREQQCGACHDAGNEMRVIEDTSASCGAAACHQRYFSEAVEHEPVAEGDCAMCHEPHRSTFSHLLRGSVVQSCADCHDPDDLGEEGHEGPEVKNCTACHDPHFGSAPYIRAKGH